MRVPEANETACVLSDSLENSQARSAPPAVTSRKWALNTALVVVLTLLACAGLATGQRRGYNYSPGRLQTFLEKDKAAVTEEKDLGNMTGRDKVMVAAIVAWDPAEPGRKLKGVRIRLVRGESGKEEVIYLDADGLECAESIRFLAKQINWLVERFRDKRPEQREWSEVTFVNNRRGESDREHITALNVGWYQSKEEIGVVIRSTQSGREYRFPGADLRTLADILSAGQMVLQDSGQSTDQNSGEKPSGP